MIRITFFLLLICLSACDAKNKNQRGKEEEKIAIEKIVLSDLSGNPVNLKEYKGKTVFLNFWATWCKPCLEEMPSIQKAMQLLKSENIVFLFASEETADQIRQFEAAYDFGFNYVRVENITELNIMGLPTTLIYNSQGKLSFSDMGYRKWDEQSNLDMVREIAKSK